MDRSTKCFDLLPSEVVELLPTKVEGLKLEMMGSFVGKPIMCLINECVNFLYCDKFPGSVNIFSEKDLNVDQSTPKFFFTSHHSVKHVQNPNSYIEMDKKLSHCLNNARYVLDITWEKLNTGYWKDVDISWRYIYSYASLFKALCLLLDKTGDVKDVIKTCDMGLIMGAPILKNILSKIAFALTSREHGEEENEAPCKKKKTSHCCEQQLGCDNMVPEAVCPSLDEFKISYMEKKQPVVLKNSIDFWPALSTCKWSVDYVMKIARHRTVPVEIGSKYTDENWTQKLITVEEFVSTYIWNDDEHRKVGYLAQYQLFDQIPQLKEDFSIPTYCCLTDGDDIDVDINAWFGPGGTVSPLHYDPKNNLLAQVFGEKYVRLYKEEFSSSLYPTDSKLLSNTSQVDVKNPDHRKFPLFASTPYQEYILKPGDVLFIPPKCWHYVQSLSVSFSISFWWK